MRIIPSSRPDEQPTAIQPAPRGHRTPRSGIRLVRALRPESLPTPPLPPSVIELLGFSAARMELLRAAAPSRARLLELNLDARVPGAALLVEASALARLGAAARAVSVVVAQTVDHETLLRAYHLGAQVLVQDPRRAELERLCVLAARAALDDPTTRRAWARSEVSRWVLDILGSCGITPRRAEIIALFATGDRRVDAAQALGISVKKVDHHVGEILDSTGQLRVEDVVAPFRDRLAAERHRSSPHS